MFKSRPHEKNDSQVRQVLNTMQAHGQACLLTAPLKSILFLTQQIKHHPTKAMIA